LPKFGFVLWRFPEAAAASEVALVVAGALLYWRAADRAATAANWGKRWAIANAVMILLFGRIVLALDTTGVAG